MNAEDLETFQAALRIQNAGIHIANLAAHGKLTADDLSKCIQHVSDMLVTWKVRYAELVGS